MRKYIAVAVAGITAVTLSMGASSAQAKPVPPEKATSIGVYKAAVVLTPTQVVSFNASPEPVGFGDKIYIDGTIQQKPSATWVKYPNAKVTIQIRPEGGSYTTLKNVTANAEGKIHSPHVVTGTASYRFVMKATSTHAGVTGGGDNVLAGPVVVTATTQVKNWPDSAVGGENWAKDTFKRDLSVKRTGPAKNGCGENTECWKYQFDVKDDGTFKSFRDAPLPNGPVGGNLHGVMRGSFDGGLKGYFYAETPFLVAGKVPASRDADVDGKVATSFNWGTLALPTGEKFWGATWADLGSAATDEYFWTYVASAPETCEVLSQGSAGNHGNITGVNNCIE